MVFFSFTHSVCNGPKRQIKSGKEEEKKNYGPVWYMCLKTENCCLKTFVKIRVGEKVCGNT